MRTTPPAVPLLDTMLDRTVIPGYTRIGYLLRRRGWPEQDPMPEAMRGRTALVTGASSGIGKSIACALAQLGATVLIAVRNRQRGEQAAEEITATVPGAVVRVEVCDVSSLSAVRAFAADLVERLDRLDVLVHNAGVLPTARSETDDGHEIALATHVLGPILLTELLEPTLAKSTDARVILMSSGGMYTQAVHLEDLEYRQTRYRGATAYARTKRMQVALTDTLARRWAESGIAVCCLHPGWVDTPGIAESLPRFHRLIGPLLRSAAEGADTAVWLAATTQAPPTGLFWQDRQPRAEHYLPRTRETAQDRDRLWRFCAEAVDIVP